MFCLLELRLKEMRLTGTMLCRGLLVAGLLGLAACTTPTPYQPVTDRYGYAEQPLETDRYRVSFAGNNLTPREKVEDFLLYRAAEVTLDSGNDYFILVDQDTERFTTFRTTTTGFGGFSGLYGSPYFFNGRWYGPGSFATATSRPRERYTAYANIIVHQGEKPLDDADAYDARSVIERLGPTIVRAPES